MSIKAILEKLKSNPSYFNEIDEDLSNSVSFCLLAIKSNPYVYEYLSDDMKCHREIVHVMMNILLMKQEEYRNKIDDIDLILEEVKKNPDYISQVNDKFTEDVSFCSRLLRVNPYAYSYLPEKMQCHREIVHQMLKVLMANNGNYQNITDEKINVMTMN